MHARVQHDRPHSIALLGTLLTNAKKVTVSVLYWYEKLSSLLTEIFKLILKRIKNFFMTFIYLSERPRGAAAPLRTHSPAMPLGTSILS